ncbi:MAG: hypothetical protein KJ799_13545 [Bacteroidetes bacterium]|nr:hypothetical protein [Bacteroidota bacterium]MBU1679766.1 hypothetical protein [Bacteroidota bacterium]MBU2507730.1 hypothetical protein [Bacteroidota bacterium]
MKTTTTNSFNNWNIGMGDYLVTLSESENQFKLIQLKENLLRRFAVTSAVLISSALFFTILSFVGKF